MVAVLDRPRVAAKFDTEKNVFTTDELEDVLTPYFTSGDASENFVATQLLGLSHEPKA